MSSIALNRQKACIEGSWQSWEAIGGIKYCVAGANYHVVYSSTLSLSSGQKLTGFTVSTNFVGNGSTGARTVTCYLYTWDPTGSTSGPPSGYTAAVTLSNKYFYNYGEYVSFAFSNLDIQSGGTLYLWFYNQMSANPSNDQIYGYATGNAYTRTPAISGGTFANTDLTDLNLSSSEVSTGGTQVATIGNLGGRTVTIEVYYGSTRLYAGSTTTGTLNIPVTKAWFTTAGLRTVQSFSVSVRASATGSATKYANFTVKAGDDMKPTVGTPSTSIVQASGNPTTYFPSTYIAGYSKTKVAATVATGSNAAISTVVLSYPGGSNINMTLNSSTGKYEATTPVLNTSAAFTVTVTDERGFTAAANSSTVTVVPYSKPALEISAAYTWRCNSGGAQQSGGAYWRAMATASYYSSLSGNGLLVFTAQVQGVGSAVNLTSGQQTAAQGGSLVSTTSYTLVFTIQDKVSEAVTKTFRLESVARGVVLKSSGNGLAVGVGTTPTAYADKSTVELPQSGRFMMGEIPANAFHLMAGQVYDSGENLSGNSFNKDFYSVNFLNNSAAENAAAAFVVGPDSYQADYSYSNWANVPGLITATDWFVGVRKCYRLSAWEGIIIEIIEMAPVPGRLWYCRVRGDGQTATVVTSSTGWYYHTPAGHV